MLSKNNYQERLRKMEPRKERFSIRKFSIGAASVLIGFSFMNAVENQKVQAATEDKTVVINAKSEQANASEADNDVAQKHVDNGEVSTAVTAKQNNSDSTITSSPIQASLAVTPKEAKDTKQELPSSNAQEEKSENKDDSTVATTNSGKSDKKVDTVNTNAAEVNTSQASANEGRTLTRAAVNLASTSAATPAATSRTLRGTQTQDASDWQSFVNAMNNGSIGTINITGDIVVDNTANGIQQAGSIGSNKNYLYLDSQGSAGAVDVNGNNHKFTFADYTLAFQSKNEENIDKTWDVTFKDMTIEATSSSYAPISFYKTSENDILTYENVTANLDNRPLVDSYSEDMTVNLNKVHATVANADDNVVTGNVVNVSGSTLAVDKASNVINGTTTVNFADDNTITVTNMEMGGISKDTAAANAVYSDKVNFVSGTTTFNVDGDIAGKTGSAINANNWMIRAASQDADTVVINQGATVNLNSKSANMRGIWAGSQSAAGQPSYGSLVVNGALNADMANGHSTTIFAQNLDIGKDASVKINTQQDNQADGAADSLANQNMDSDSTHQAPITIFLGPNNSLAAPVSAQEGHIINNGSLTVIRNNPNKTLVPLISFGQGVSTNMTLKLISGQGSTLDLQDNSATYSDGTEPDSPYSGLITMWGTSGKDVLQFDAPQYINLQRTGDTRGTLIRLEGVDNTTTINGPTPVAQWDQANKSDTPNYGWYVDLVDTQNQWGNYSGTFLGKDQTPNPSVAHNGVQTLYNSNATVKMATNQGGQEYNKDNTDTTDAALHLNSFLNNFNYWRPQRIAMGDKITPTINDTDKYQPEVQTIDGTTKQTLQDLKAQDGIKDLLGPNNTTITDFDNIINSVSWYDSATDKADWNKIMIQPTESKDPADQKPYAEPQNPAGDLKTTDKSAWAKITYKDGTVSFVNIPLNITEAMTNAYTPSYNPISVEQGQTATNDPGFTDPAGKDTTAPTGTTFATGPDAPTWTTIDPATGTVTIKPSADVTPGAYNVPVTVTYPDKSTDETTVAIIVTKAGQEVTWGDNGAIVTSVDTSKLNAHETTDNSQVLSPADVVSAAGYELKDGKLSTTAIPVTIDPSSVSWTTVPDTTVKTAVATGKQISTEISIDFTKNDAAKNILGTNNGIINTDPFTIDAKGAGAKNVTTPVEVTLGSNLTSEQFKQLVDSNIPADEIASAAWLTKPDVQGQNGVIKITFTDKDANGNPTYLNIPILAGSIHVTDTTSERTLVIDYVDTEGKVIGTYNVSGKPGEQVDVDVVGNVPTNWTLVPNQSVLSTFVFKSTDPELVSYTVEHKIEYIPIDKDNSDTYHKVTQVIKEIPAGKDNAIVVRSGEVEFSRLGTKDLVTGEITWDAWRDKDGNSTFTFPAYDIKQQQGYDSYVNGTKAAQVPDLTVDPSYPDAADTITYVKQGTSAVPYLPGKDGVNDDMNRYVTRTIVVNEPRKPAVSQQQTVHFSREDAQGNGGYTDPVTGQTTWNAWHVATDLNETNGKWDEFAAPVVDGYVADPMTVASAVVKPEMNNVQVDVNYVPTDATKYTPEGQDVKTETGKTPDASEGIKNKEDLPEGTSYTWKETPDVTTEGEKPATVVVTYPDGSTDEVPVTVQVTNPETDADKYTPEGQDVKTETGKTPDASEGIKNKEDLPEGTTYSWKEAPDVTTEGEKPATVVVTYPDGSTDEVPVTVQVTNPETDADKYTPEGQDVKTETGKTPDPSEGIKNKEDLPEGTTYSWKEAPDVTTEGEKPATVVVTYPDGSTDEVPVTVQVTNPETDADKYTPEGQDVKTETGKTPDPSEDIKNKDDLPEGTSYTWKETPDVTTEGEKPATVVVTYPDGSTDEVPVTVQVTNPETDADKYTPEGQDVKTETGKTPDPSEGIKNKDDLPEGTSYTWKETPDVTTEGEKAVTVVVTYPDGSTDEVPVTVQVTNPETDADKYTPEGQDVKTETGKTPDPSEAIKNKDDLPEGTTYTWKETPDVTTEGEKAVTVVVTYPDGSTDEVTAEIVVITNNVAPEIQPVHTLPGVLPNPADSIKNKDELPEGTTYSWKELPSVDTVGEHTGIVTVTYPDRSSVDVTVKVYVDESAKEFNSGNSEIAHSSSPVSPATSSQQVEKTTLPQTGSKSENAVGLLGLLVASVGSLLGLSENKKRRNK